MRIATGNAFDTGIASLQRRQQDLYDSQAQLTSGKRIERASDDPAAAARAERALAGIGRASAARRAVGASEGTMREAEGAIADAVSLLQQARETVVAAGDASYSDAERLGLAAKLRAIRSQLLGIANRSDGAGTWVFGGQGAGTPPFVDTPAGVVYTATPGALTTAGDLQISTDGRATWLAAPTGNGVFETRPGAGVTQAWIGPGHVVDPAALTGSTYQLQFGVAAGTTTYAVLRDGLPTAVVAAPFTPGQAIVVDGMSFAVNGAPANGDTFDVLPSTNTASIFATLDAAAGELATGSRSGAQVAQTVSTALRDLDSALGALQTQRTVAGEALNRVDQETSRIDAQELRDQTARSAAEDLDMVQAVSEFQQRQTGYDAALKSYSMVQRLSLFDYLGR
jgi:flagellar hook-associated protein 3 FlgL